MDVEEMEVVCAVDGNIHIGLQYGQKDQLHGNGPVAEPIYPYNQRHSNEIRMVFNVANQQHETLVIQFSKTYLQRWNDIPLLDEFLNKANKKTAMDSITPKMYMLIHDILHCQQDGPLRKMYLEAKVLELLCVSMENLNQTSTINSAYDLREADVEKIQLVKEHILQNIANPGSLSDLARHAGINQHKLKTGFKQLYRTSVLAFIIDSRLHKAKMLLLEPQYSIKAIANMMGYRDRSNFTAAFRKKFGYAPNKVKR